MYFDRDYLDLFTRDIALIDTDLAIVFHFIVLGGVLNPWSFIPAVFEFFGILITYVIVSLGVFVISND